MSSPEVDRVLTWELCNNTLRDRLVDKSLAHVFTPDRKIKKRTKLSNTQLQSNHLRINNYKDYIKIRTAVLRTLSGDEDTAADDTDVEIVNVSKNKKLTKKKRTKRSIKSRKKSTDSSEENRSPNSSDSDGHREDADEPPDELDIDERIKLQNSSDTSPDPTPTKKAQKTPEKSRPIDEKNIVKDQADSPKKTGDAPREIILKNEIFEEFKGAFSQDLMSDGPSQDVDNEAKVEEEENEPLSPVDDDRTTFDSPSDSNEFDEEMSLSNDGEQAVNNQEEVDDAGGIDEPEKCSLEAEGSLEIPSYQVPVGSEEKDPTLERERGNNLISVCPVKTRKDIKRNLNKLLDSVDSNESSDSVKSLVADVPDISLENPEINSDKQEDFILPVSLSAEEMKLINPTVGPSDSGIDEDSRDNFNKNFDVEILNRKHNPKITSDQVIASKIKIIRCKNIIESDVKILPELSPEKPIVDSDSNEDENEKNEEQDEEDSNKIVACCSSFQQNDVEALDPSSRESDKEHFQDDSQDIDETIDQHSEQEPERQVEKTNTAVSLTEDESLQLILNKYAGRKKAVEQSEDEDETSHQDEIDKIQEDVEESQDSVRPEENDVQISQDPNEKNESNNEDDSNKRSGNKNLLVGVTEADSLNYVLQRCTSRQQYLETNPLYQNASMLDNSQVEVEKEKSPEPFEPRPKDIIEFIARSNLEFEEKESTILLDDLSVDHDFWTMEVPKSVFEKDLRGKKFKMMKRKLIIGDMKFDIERRERESLPTVLRTNSKKRPYKIGIIIPQANVVVTGKRVKEEIAEEVDELKVSGLDSESLPAESREFKEPGPALVKSKRKKKRKQNVESLADGSEVESIDLVFNRKTKRKKIADGNLVENNDGVKPGKKKKRKTSEDLSDKSGRHSDSNLSGDTEPLFKKKKRKKLISPGKD